MLSKQPTTDESVFAKALTDPDASTRKKTLGALQSYLEQGQSVSHYKLKNFLRLWKILYYTMWLTDKLPIQQEMIESLVGLVDKMQLPQQILFFEAFHVILLKEWNLLDQYRMNKFYLLTRSMLQKLFQLMAEAKWHLTTVSTLRRVLDRVLTTSPNGPRFHIIDIFMEELHKSSIGKVSTGAFLELLHPFLELLQSNVDKVVKQRIRENLVLKLLQMQYPSNQEGCGQPASKPAFPKLSCVALQKKIFQLASDESTLDSSRSVLYKLHKAISLQTGVLHYDDDEEQEQEQDHEAPVDEDLTPQAPQAEKMKKGEKKRKSRGADDDNEEREDAAKGKEKRKKKHA